MVGAWTQGHCQPLKREFSSDPPFCVPVCTFQLERKRESQQTAAPAWRSTHPGWKDGAKGGICSLLLVKRLKDRFCPWSLGCPSTQGGMHPVSTTQKEFQAAALRSRSNNYIWKGTEMLLYSMSIKWSKGTQLSTTSQRVHRAGDPGSVFTQGKRTKQCHLRYVWALSSGGRASKTPMRPNTEVLPLFLMTIYASIGVFPEKGLSESGGMDPQLAWSQWSYDNVHQTSAGDLALSKDLRIWPTDISGRPGCSVPPRIRTLVTTNKRTWYKAMNSQ